MKKLLLHLLLISATCTLFAQAPVITSNVGMPTGYASARGVAYGNSVYVGILNSGKIYTSADGNSWSKVAAAGVPAGTFNSIVFGGGLFVIVGQLGQIITSTDGITWTSRTSGTSNTLSDVQFLQSKFYVVGQNSTLLSSAAGTTWSTITIGSGVGVATDQFNNITYGAGAYVIGASGRGGTLIYRSTTAASNSWTFQNVFYSKNGGLNKVQYLKDKFYVFTSGTYIYTSADGITFTDITASPLALPNATFSQIGMPNQAFSGIYDGTKIYFFGYTPTYNNGSIYSTTDGTNFTLQSKTAYISGASSAYANGKFFQFGNEGILTSSDGIAYRYPTGTFAGAASSGTSYIGVSAISFSGSIFSSTDFVTWTERTPSSAQSTLNAVVYTGSKYVAAGDKTVLQSVDDGITWTAISQVTTPVDNFMNLAYGASLYIGGSVGKIASSADGATWTTRNTDDNSYFKIKYVNGKFFALGISNSTYLGVILYSADGITWTDVTPPNYPNAYYYNDVVYDGSKFYFMGMEYTDLVSYNYKGFFSTSTATPANVNSYSNKGSISSPPAGTMLGGTWGEGAFSYSNGRFVGAVNDVNSVTSPNDLYVIYSTDGTNWTAVQQNESSIITSAISQGNTTRLLGLGDGKFTVTFTGVLPVGLTKFQAFAMGKQSVLQWQTSSEQNSQHFTVQYSTNNTSWTNLTVVKAAGNSSTTKDYHYLHTNPVNGSNYYRLQQTDINGNAVYSNICNVQFSTANAAYSILVNPVKNVLALQINKPVVLSLYTSDGSFLWTKQFNAGLTNIDVTKYAKGIYLLKSDDTTARFLHQ